MIVLDGATSQWKRAVWSSRAIGPPRVVAGRDPLERVEMRAHCLRVEHRARARRAALVERGARGEVLGGAAEDDHADVHPLAALDPRHDAVDRVRERATRPRARSASSTKSRGAVEPRAQVVDVQLRISPSSQSSGIAAATIARARRRVTSGASRASASRDRAGEGQQHVLGDLRERRPLVPGARPRRRGGSTAPRRGRSARGGRASAACSCCCAVRSTFVTSASNQTIVGGELGVGQRAGGRAERQGARQEVDAEVEPRARGEQVLDLRVGLRARRAPGSSSTSASSGTAKPSARRELARDDLGDQRLRAPAPRRGT